MNHGSCLCGAVHYQVDGALGPIILCHCSRCRKATGSAFAAVSPIPALAFRVTQGQDALGSYRSSAEVERFFCTRCGSPVYSRRDSLPDLVRLRVGTLDSDPGEKPAEHIFVGSKAPWFDIHDDAPQREERV